MAARAFLDALALRMAAILEHAEVVEVLARRNLAQRIGGPDHGRRVRVQAMDALDESVAEAALEQDGGQRGGGHRLKLVACALTEGHGGPPVTDDMRPAAAQLPTLVNSCHCCTSATRSSAIWEECRCVFRYSPRHWPRSPSPL